MNIAFVTASLSRNAGGLFESVRNLARAVQADGNSVRVVGVKDSHANDDIESWKPLDVQIHSVLGPDRFHFAPGLNSTLKSLESDVLHSHGIWNYTSVAVSRWYSRTGKPYVVHPHGMLDPWAVRHSNLKKFLANLLYEKSHLQNATCIRALCESEAQSIRAFGLKNPICVIPNGIDLPRLDEAQMNDGPLHTIKQAGIKVLLYLGRIHPKKGLANLLPAWKSAIESRSLMGKQWVLAIAGWDEKGHESELKKLATELQLSWKETRENDLDKFPTTDIPSLLFLGPQFGKAKVASYYQCDAFILPSLSEGLPMTVLEAWSYGKPALITPECNLPEGFTAGAALKITPDVAGIKQGLVELIGMSETERQAMGTRGQKLIKEQFTWPTIARELGSVSQWLLGGGSVPDCVRVSR